MSERSNRSSGKGRSGTSGRKPPHIPPIDLDDEYLTDISSELLREPTALLPPQESHDHDDRNIVYTYTLDDERLDKLVPVGAAQRRADDKLKTLVVRVVLSTYTVTFLCILGIIVGLGINARNVDEASQALARFLDSAGPFIQIVFGGSTVALVIMSLSGRPPSKPPTGGDDQHDRHEGRLRRDDDGHEQRYGRRATDDVQRRQAQHK